MPEKYNSKNIKFLFFFLFLIVVIISIIIGIQKGKRDMSKLGEYEQPIQKEIISFKKNILDAPPLHFDIKIEKLEPVNYVYKISMKEKLSIIDEKGNVIKSDKPENLFYEIFSYDIIDTDIINEEKLKKTIKFEVIPQIEEERYPGFIERETILTNK